MKNAKNFHVNYLSSLKEGYGKGMLCFPKAEGAFYFGEALSYDDYVDQYEAKLIELDWIVE